jgi:hypothetical protein
MQSQATRLNAVPQVRRSKQLDRKEDVMRIRTFVNVSKGGREMGES